MQRKISERADVVDMNEYRKENNRKQQEAFLSEYGIDTKNDEFFDELREEKRREKNGYERI